MLAMAPSVRVIAPQTYGVGIPGNNSFTNGWPTLSPGGRFTAALTDADARLGVNLVNPSPSSWRTLTAYSVPVSRRTSV